MLPAIVVAVAALSAGAVAGRKYIKGEVDKRKQTAIEEAALLVQDRIKDAADLYIRANLKSYVRNTAVKLALLGMVVGAFHLGWLRGPYAAAALAVMFAGFLVYDAVRIWPSARLALSELRRQNWKPRQALAEIVAAHVFDQVLAEARARKSDLWSDISLRIAGQKADEVSQEIAAAVADIARQTSWQDLKPFLISGAAKFTGLVLVYSAAVFFLVQTLR